MFSCIFSCFKPNTVVEKPPNPVDTFIATQKEKFNQLDRDKINANIEPEFYDLEKYNNIVKDADNILETQWRTRIMSKQTPRGVVYMHYDAYKQGFAYFCTENLSYRVINSIAIDYIRTFHCYDFFVDGNYFDDDYKNPSLEVHQPKPKPVVDSSNNSVPNVKQGPFIQRKRKDTKDTQTTKDTQDTQQSETEKPKLPKHQNKFIYLGHPRNMSVLQKPKTPNKSFNSPIMNSMKKMSWAEYKASKSTQ